MHCRCHLAFVIKSALLFFFCFAPASEAIGRWTEQKSGTLAWLHAVYFLNDKKGWVAGGNGALLSTEDGGSTWNALKKPTTDKLLDVFFKDEQEGWLICESDIYQLRDGELRSYLLHTTDGGAKWQRVNLLGVNREARLLRFVMGPDGKGWLIGELGALFTTQDNGKTWLAQPSPSRFLLLGGAMFGAQQSWLVGAGSTILYTIDAGTTWRKSTLKNQAIQKTKSESESPRVKFYSVSFANEKQGWVVGQSGKIYSTTDGGRTWSALASGVEEDLFDVKFFDANEGWTAGANGTLLYTNNGGNTWTGAQTGTRSGLERLVFVNRDKGWAVGFGGTILAYSSKK